MIQQGEVKIPTLSPEEEKAWLWPDQGKKEIKRAKVVFLDWILLNVIYFGIHLSVVGAWTMKLNYAKLLLLMNGAWLFISLIEDKFSLQQMRSFLDIMIKLARITLLMLFVTSFTLVLLGLHDFHRLYILGTFILLFLNEAIAVGIHYPRLYARMSEQAQYERAPRRLSISMILTDLVIYLTFFLFVHYFKYHSLILGERAVQILGIMVGFWWLSAHWTGKFEKRHHANFFYAYEPFIKAALLMTSAATLLIFSFGLFQYSRGLLLAPVVFLLLAEAFLVLMWVRVRSVIKEPDIEHLDQANRFLGEEILEITPAADFQESARAQLQQHYLIAHGALYRLLDSRLDLNKIDLSTISVLDTHTTFNVHILQNQSLQLFINLHRVNDFRRLNHYFLTVHTKLVLGGYFIGLMETLEARKAKLEEKYPRNTAELLYGLDFLYHRVMPKLPIVKKLYYTFSNGLGQAISYAELLGRLYFCGFRIITAEKKKGYLYFIAQKDKTPNLNEEPSSGMLVRMKRIGYQGQIIYLYKLRTMHPYSEFIQNYVFQQNRLDENGKIKDDFRVTVWGRVLRKFWLDELPQLYNYLRGDVKIVGARALSEHFFSLYPKDLQKLRIQFKPGLVPPFYADLPKSFEEIVCSERRYFERKRSHPIRTDWQYFIKAIYNILFNKARSQ